jgi:hypothetical protein
MPHVDDGTLHALLDGALRAEDPARADAVEAHLETCPDCTALLEQAAALRTGTASILAALEPDARPDFDEVLARAGAGVAGAVGVGGPAGGRVHGRATRGLAWAATLVLALGTGYLVRDRLGTDPVAPTPPTALSRTAPESVADARDPARTAVPDGRAAGPAAKTATGPLSTEEAGAGERGVLAERRAAVPAPEPGPAAGEAVAAGEPAVTGGAPARSEVAGRAAVTVAEPSLALRPAAGAPAMALEAGLAAPEWRSISIAEAGTLMDGPVYVLEGAEVIALLARGRGAHAEVRSRQLVAPGVELEVSQRRLAEADRQVGRLPPAGAAPAADRDAEATELEVQESVEAVHHRHRITVTGALPARILERLAAGARPLRD